MVGELVTKQEIKTNEFTYLTLQLCKSSKLNSKLFGLLDFIKVAE
jgi:hypothetical protein